MGKPSDIIQKMLGGNGANRGNTPATKSNNHALGTQWQMQVVWNIQLNLFKALTIKLLLLERCECVDKPLKNENNSTSGEIR